MDDLAPEKAGITYETLDLRQYGIHALGTAYLAAGVSPDRRLGARLSDLDQATLMIGPETDSKSDRDMLRRALERERELLRPGGARFGEVLKNRWSDMYTFMVQRTDQIAD